jgi:hypothetical protein
VKRTRTAVLVAVPLAAAAVGLTLYAGPYWVDVARHRLEEQRWPAQRARIEAAVAGVALPAGYVEEPCGGAPDPDARCWHVDARPEDVPEDLAAALRAAGVEGVATELAPVEGASTVALARGTVDGRVVGLFATREPDEAATRASGDLVLRPGTVVRSTADLVAP